MNEAQDIIGRQITAGNHVFFNNRVYQVKRIVGGGRIALNNARGWQLVREKIRSGAECCLVEDNPALTEWLKESK